MLFGLKVQQYNKMVPLYTIKMKTVIYSMAPLPMAEVHSAPTLTLLRGPTHHADIF